MTGETMEDLFIETLKDIFYSEKHILKALPSMLKKASSEELKKVWRRTGKRAKGQVDRLDQVFQLLSCRRAERSVTPSKVSSSKPKSISRRSKTEVLDAGMIASAQAVAHYEIARYGTLIASAKQLGREDAIELLEANLKQEKHADALLTEIAEAALNRKAAA